MVIAGAPSPARKASDGVPNSTTAATWSATSSGSGVGAMAAGTELGTVSEVANPDTTAPCEKPPSTMRVSGQSRDMVSTRLPASRTPSITVAANASRSAKLLPAG